MGNLLTMSKENDKLKKKLKEIQRKAPRHSAPPGKIFKDKSKYTRKRKHKGNDEAE